jgi:GTP-binding protein
MFADTAKVIINAGQGGSGYVNFRHEKYINHGGPDGGDGGKGGDVIFIATPNLNTLVDFRYKPELRATDGTDGSKNNRHGADGETLYVKVPIGTVVRREGKIIADFDKEGQEVVIAKGGDGGFGNAHFKSSVRQTPRMAEKGEPGDSFEADLELKLLADVGLIGLPNAGKSTFLSVVSNARPEIADYAFTTLTPNLGVADIDDGSLLIADIPGLIEGASEGKGLGDAFLRHVERTAVLLHLIDAYDDDVAKAYVTIQTELQKYDTELAKRPEIIALTKTEGLDSEMVQMQVDAIKAVAGSTPVFVVSSTAHHGITEVLRALRKMVITARQEVVLNDEDDQDQAMETISLDKNQLSEAWFVEKIEAEDSNTYYRVSGDKIEKFARRTIFGNYEAENRLRDIMQKMGITRELKHQGADGNSTIQINSDEFTLLEQ